MGVLGLGILYWVAPGIKNAMARSKNAQVKHWGTVLVLTAALLLFVFLLVSSVRQ